jgi:hypothetical protein
MLIFFIALNFVAAKFIWQARVLLFENWLGVGAVPVSQLPFVTL